MATKPYRVLLYNIGYGTGLTGSMRDYFLRFYRYIYTPRAIIRKVRQSIYMLMNRVQPDLCCFVEVHRRHGFVPHPHAFRSHIDNKYGRFSILRFLPFFRDNCNGFFCHGQLKFQKRYFRHGTKKLIYDIDLGHGIGLLLVHFSLKPATRQKQCEDLKEILWGRPNTIVCGDFNTFRGTTELQQLAEECGLRIVNAAQPTFPATKPEKALDLFLCPKNFTMAKATVFTDVKVSDHLPVMLEVAA
jgi:hypothetical protein